MKKSSKFSRILMGPTMRNIEDRLIELEKENRRLRLVVEELKLQIAIVKPTEP